MAAWERFLGRPQREAHAAWVRRGRFGEGRVALDGADLSDARFGAASLEGIQLHACRMDRFTIDMAKLDGGQLLACRGTRGALYLCRCDDVTMKDTTLSQYNLSGSDFVRARIAGCTFDDSGFERAKFIDCEVESTSFRSCLMRDLYVRGSRFVECDLSSVVLDKGKGTNCRFEDAVFSRCKLTGADLTGRPMKNVLFEACDLSDVSGIPAAGSTWRVVGGPIPIPWQ